jgi:uncharacterized membrane protein
MDTVRAVIRLLFTIIFFSAGIYHLVEPEFFLVMMPPYIPMHTEVIYATGVLEIIGAVSLQFEGAWRWAGWAMIAYLIAILPAHVYMYQEKVFIEGFLETPDHLAARIGLQFALVVALYFAAASPNAE